MVQRRAHNEDGYLVRPDAGIWMVADGMAASTSFSLIALERA